MMDWHLTWQDPVALAVCLVSLALTLWLRERLQSKSGCASCPKGAAKTIAAPPQSLIPASHLRPRR